MKPRVLLADDHPLLTEGFRLLLEPEFNVVGSVVDGRALLAAAAELKPDVVLLDISMPLLNGIEAAKQLHKSLPACRIIFVTMHLESEYVTAAFKAGARGFVSKRAAVAELREAIRQVLAGRHYVTPLVTREALAPLLNSRAVPDSESKDPLTARQREVLQLVAEGRSRKEIASILQISVKTVEFHKAAIMRELGLNNAAEMIRYALAHRIIAG